MVEGCDTERHRQNLFNISTERMLAASNREDSHDTEKLPVVELRPFREQTWNRAQSLPDYYDTRSVASFASSRRSGYFSDMGYPDPDKFSLTPRDEECPRIQHLFSGKPPKPKPKVKFKKSKSFPTHPTAFANLITRQKTTFDDIRSIRSSPINLPDPITKPLIEIKNPPNMIISGRKIHDLPPRTSFLYSAANDYYQMRRSYTMPIQRDTQSMVEDISTRLQTIRSVYSDDGVYPSLERISMLPSIQIKNAPMKRRKQPPLLSESTSRKSSASFSSRPSYRLGVQNTLHFLSQYGKPTGIEQQLSMQLKNRLEQLRKTRHVRTDSGDLYSKQSPRLPQTQTLGEVSILEGLEIGAKKDHITAVSSVKSFKTTKSRNGEFCRSTPYVRDSGIESYQGDIPTESPNSKGLTLTLAAQLEKLIVEKEKEGGADNKTKAQSLDTVDFRDDSGLSNHDPTTPNVTSPGGLTPQNSEASEMKTPENQKVEVQTEMKTWTGAPNSSSAVCQGEEGLSTKEILLESQVEVNTSYNSIS